MSGHWEIVALAIAAVLRVLVPEFVRIVRPPAVSAVTQHGEQ